MTLLFLSHSQVMTPAEVQATISKLEEYNPVVASDFAVGNPMEKVTKKLAAMSLNGTCGILCGMSLPQ